jgi:hypothetical protein
MVLVDGTVTSETMLKSYPPGPQNVTAFENRVVVDISG